jgi:hypothetical protein
MFVICDHKPKGECALVYVSVCVCNWVSKKKVKNS